MSSQRWHRHVQHAERRLLDREQLRVDAREGIQRVDLTERHEIDHVVFAALQFQDAGVVIGDVLDVDLVNGRRGFPVIRVAMQDERVTLLPAGGVVPAGAL